VIQVFQDCGVVVKHDRTGIVGLIEGKEFGEASLPSCYMTQEKY